MFDGANVCLSKKNLKGFVCVIMILAPLTIFCMDTYVEAALSQEIPESVSDAVKKGKFSKIFLVGSSGGFEEVFCVSCADATISAHVSSAAQRLSVELVYKLNDQEGRCRLSLNSVDHQTVGTLQYPQRYYKKENFHNQRLSEDGLLRARKHAELSYESESLVEGQPLRVWHTVYEPSDSCAIFCATPPKCGYEKSMLLLTLCTDDLPIVRYTLAHKEDRDWQLSEWQHIDLKRRRCQVKGARRRCTIF